MAITINVNGLRHSAKATADTPLLYVLRDELKLRGPKFGCGLAQCGACAVLLDGDEIRSCVTPVAAVTGRRVTTLEGLPALHAGRNGKSAGALHPVQQAWIDEQVPQCGYCQNGMIIQAVALLDHTPHPSDALIKTAMNAHLCRCATYNAIVRAIKRAAKTMA
jgi:isoquinoline 1-oxidoreductase subunit alpha